MEFLLPLLGGALGAALINGVLAVYKLRHDVDLEHRQWSRNQRQETYFAFLSAVTDAKSAFDRAFYDTATNKEASRSECDRAMAAVQKLRPEIFLVAPPYVFKGGATDIEHALFGLSKRLQDAEDKARLEVEDMDEWDAAAGKLDMAMYYFIQLARADLGHFAMEENRQHNIRLVRRLNRQDAVKRGI